jgi:hypothetical protein
MDNELDDRRSVPLAVRLTRPPMKTLQAPAPSGSTVRALLFQKMYALLFLRTPCSNPSFPFSPSPGDRPLNVGEDRESGWLRFPTALPPGDPFQDRTHSALGGPPNVDDVLPSLPLHGDRIRNQSSLSLLAV